MQNYYLCSTFTTGNLYGDIDVVLKSIKAFKEHNCITNRKENTIDVI